MKLQFNRDGWTDWIQHDHKGCPVVGYYVKCKTNYDPETISGDYKKVGYKLVEGVCRNPSEGSWSGHPVMVRVDKYKVRKPLGASKLEEMLKDLPKEPKSKQLENT